MKTIALYSSKGGVGKTAAAVNLSYLAAQSGAKTLICDLDSQGSATYYFRVKPRLKKKAQGFSQAGRPIERSIKATDYAHLDLLPADFTHRNLDIAFLKAAQPQEQLRRILAPLSAEYDLIFLDCPPTFNILAENIFRAADMLLVPLIPTTLSVRTYVQLRAFLQQNGYDTEAVTTFFSLVDGRKKMHRELAAAVYRKFDHVCKTPIPYRSQIEKMGLYRAPVSVFAPHSVAALAYQSLWQEIQGTLETSP